MSRAIPAILELERAIRRVLRWTAMATVVEANRKYDGIGGHISTYASASTLYEVGFNHFFQGGRPSVWGRSGLFPGALVAGDLFARVPGRAGFSP